MKSSGIVLAKGVFEYHWKESIITLPATAVCCVNTIFNFPFAFAGQFIPRFVFSMASKDLDIDQLALYLHITPSEVSKMAVRGKIPGRRVNNEWRFSESEIHHWLEDRIGVGDAQELERVERVLERNIDVTSDERAMLSDFLSPLPVFLSAFPFS